MGCRRCGKRKIKGQDGEDVLVCNRDVSICGSINLPQGFTFVPELGIDFAINACLKCRTEDVSVTCTPDMIDNCGSIMIQAKAVRAVGCFNYVISIPIQSTCPQSNAYVSLENSACVDQIVCIQDSMFECDPAIAACDLSFIFLSFHQIQPERCTAPSRVDVEAIVRLFKNTCASSSSEALPQSGEPEIIIIDPK
jgi:hypothetical protein